MSDATGSARRWWMRSNPPCSRLFLGPDGPRGRRRAPGPAARLPGSARKSALARVLQRAPSLRRPIMKPRKIVVKGAPRASLRDPSRTLDHESRRGFLGAYRRDDRLRALT